MRTTIAKRGHQHHPKFLGTRQPASAGDVITALRAASVPGGGELLRQLDDQQNNNCIDPGALAGASTSDLGPKVVHGASDRGGSNKSEKVVGSLASAQVEHQQKNVSNLLIESPRTNTLAAGPTHTTNKSSSSSARDGWANSGRPEEVITSESKLIRDDDGAKNKETVTPVLEQGDSAPTHCDTNAEEQLIEDKERPYETSDLPLKNDDRMEVDSNGNPGDSKSVLTERNTNKSAKRRSIILDVDEDGRPVPGPEGKRKSPPASSKKGSSSGKEKKKSSRSKAANTGDAVSTEMTSSQESRSEDTENDPEAAEWAKLRCTSERTEVVAEREYRRQNRRCADYPGLAFGRSVFSSDTMMKFNIIRNELHNIMKTQLKRVR